MTRKRDIDDVMELPEAIRKQLLDPLVWQDALIRFVEATNLAALLTDSHGRALGNCLNAQPTWLMLRGQKPAGVDQCPFCIEPARNGSNCVIDALETGTVVTTSDASGLVHSAVPLFLFNQRLGALITGQVFGSYPNHLQLHDLARKLQISAEAVWQSARLEHPMRRETLGVYASLLQTLGSTFLKARYQSITDAERLAEMTRLHQLREQLEMQQRELAAQRERQIEITARTLEETRQELRAVTGRVVSAQEEERERMARELHDNIGQSIVLCQFDIHALRRTIPNRTRRPLDAQFDAITDRISRIADEVRELSHDMHPAMLKDLGLEAAVRQLGDNLQKHHSLRVKFSGQNIPAMIDSALSLGLYRIVQEALQNVTRHAGPATVDIALRGKSDSLELSIADTGKGFDPKIQKRGLGLINMAHRAELLGGTLNLESQPGQGTTVHLRVPLQPVKL